MAVVCFFVSVGLTVLVLSPLIVVCFSFRNHDRDRYWGR
jgi:hypothetical protein